MGCCVGCAGVEIRLVASKSQGSDSDSRQGIHKDGSQAGVEEEEGSGIGMVAMGVTRL